MSFLEDCADAEVTQIRGAASTPDEYDRSMWADVARNVEFALNEQVSTRRGFGFAFDPRTGIIGVDPPVTSLFNWIQQSFNRLVYFIQGHLVAPAQICFRDMNAGVNHGYTYRNILAINGPRASIFAQFGSYLIATILEPTGDAADIARIVPADITLPITEPFAPPTPASAFSRSITPIAGGSVTEGSHLLAVVFTTSSGYETRPSPVVAAFSSAGSIADYVPFGFDATAGNKYRVQLTNFGSWSPDYVSAALLMSPSYGITQSAPQVSRRFFFVPGCTAQITGATITFPDVDISDEVLTGASSVEAVTAEKDYFALYSQASGGGPFNPFFVVPYSSRAVYFTVLSNGSGEHGLFISNQNAPQWITLANHLIQLPGRKAISTGFVLRASLYVLGPNWTYSLSDNNSLPVTWVPAQEVDGRIGTPSLWGVDANSSLGYAWVAHYTGLYLFSNGVYGARPVSYLNRSEWSRINWNAGKTDVAAAVRVKDFPERKMVLVAVPLDAATACNHIFAFDYSNGATFDSVNFSMWDVGGSLGATGGQGIAAMELVLNPTTGQVELWVALANGNVLRSKLEGDANPYRDELTAGGSTGIASVYRSAALPRVFREVMQFAAVAPRLTGQGAINPTVTTLDHTRTHALPPITASSAPGRWPMLVTDVQSEALHLQLDNGATPDAQFTLAGLKVWFGQLWGLR